MTSYKPLPGSHKSESQVSHFNHLDRDAANGSSQSKTACIIYGFMEGPWHGRRMRRALKAAGYHLVHDPAGADVVIAHSGGHLLAPDPHSGQQHLLIDASYQTGRSVLDNVTRHMAYELRHTLPHYPLFYAGKTIWNIVYFFTRLHQSLAMYHHLKAGDRPPQRFLHAIVTQSDDLSWYDPATVPPGHLHRVPAGHDDCWLHPRRYLDLLHNAR